MDPGTWAEKAAISELITRYVALNDSGEWQALAALYTEDGRMNRPTAPDDFVVGREAIRAAFEARPRRDARHIVANTLVTLDDSTHARATSQILLFTGTAQADGGLPVQSTSPPLVGTYEDRLEKHGDDWLFAERRGRLDFRKPE